MSDNNLELNKIFRKFKNEGDYEGGYKQLLGQLDGHFPHPSVKKLIHFFKDALTPTNNIIISPYILSASATIILLVTQDPTLNTHCGTVSSRLFASLLSLWKDEQQLENLCFSIAFAPHGQQHIQRNLQPIKNFALLPPFSERKRLLLAKLTWMPAQEDKCTEFGCDLFSDLCDSSKFTEDTFEKLNAIIVWGRTTSCLSHEVLSSIMKMAEQNVKEILAAIGGGKIEDPLKRRMLQVLKSVNENGVIFKEAPSLFAELEKQKHEHDPIRKEEKLTKQNVKNVSLHNLLSPISLLTSIFTSMDNGTRAQTLGFFSNISDLLFAYDLIANEKYIMKSSEAILMWIQCISGSAPWVLAPKANMIASWLSSTLDFFVDEQMLPDFSHPPKRFRDKSDQRKTEDKEAKVWCFVRFANALALLCQTYGALISPKTRARIEEFTIASLVLGFDSGNCPFPFFNTLAHDASFLSSTIYLLAESLLGPRRACSELMRTAVGLMSSLNRRFKNGIGQLFASRSQSPFLISSPTTLNGLVCYISRSLRCLLQQAELVPESLETKPILGGEGVLRGEMSGYLDKYREAAILALKNRGDILNIVKEKLAVANGQPEDTSCLHGEKNVLDSEEKDTLVSSHDWGENWLHSQDEDNNNNNNDNNNDNNDIAGESGAAESSEANNTLFADEEEEKVECGNVSSPAEEKICEKNLKEVESTLALENGAELDETLTDELVQKDQVSNENNQNNIDDDDDDEIMIESQVELLKNYSQVNPEDDEDAFLESTYGSL